MAEIAERLRVIEEHIAAACARSGRERTAVEMIAVSKTFPVEAIREACLAGQHVFGESRLQEAEPKIAASPAGLVWHFIGRVQRNKLRKLLSRFDVIHGVDSLKIAEAANDICSQLGQSKKKVFLQVNLGNEAAKAGFSADQLDQALRGTSGLPHLHVLGLMAIPPAELEPEDSRRWFRQLRELRDALEISHGVHLPALSMGMSRDYEVAIEEGATHVRIGSAIFGGRTYGVDVARS
jgi:pyridoxal phosphate enzyme (YggS family)